MFGLLIMHPLDVLGEGFPCSVQMHSLDVICEVALLKVFNASLLGFLHRFPVAGNRNIVSLTHFYRKLQSTAVSGRNGPFFTNFRV